MGFTQEEMLLNFVSFSTAYKVKFLSATGEWFYYVCPLARESGLLAFSHDKYNSGDRALLIGLSVFFTKITR